MALHKTYNADFANATAGYSAGSTIGVREQIRFLIQDNANPPTLMYDEEIDWTQTQEMNAYTMAARCCESLAARNAGATSKKIGDLAMTFNPQFYKALAEDLRARGITYQSGYVGGISIADKIAQEANADAVAPAFFRDEFNNPSASQPPPGTSAADPLSYGPGV